MSIWHIGFGRFKGRQNRKISPSKKGEEIKLPKDMWQLDDSYKNVIKELSKR